MQNYKVFGIHIKNHAESAGDIQKILTEYGCNIQTRVGLHNVKNDLCSLNGVILIHFLGSEEVAGEFREKLLANPGVEVQTMVF